MKIISENHLSSIELWKVLIEKQNTHTKQTKNKKKEKKEKNPKHKFKNQKRKEKKKQNNFYLNHKNHEEKKNNKTLRRSFIYKLNTKNSTTLLYNDQLTMKTLACAWFVQSLL